MFTGLIERVGDVARIGSAGAGRRITVAETTIATEAAPGDSVAINGTCLTVVEQTAGHVAFDAGPETLSRTTLGQLRVGSRVNLERALPAGGRIGGHFVQGHIDGVGHVGQRTGGAEWDTVWVDVPEELTRLMVPKGSVAVDGVSLTIVDLASTRFSVALIPFTQQHTTLGSARVGQAVNIETDILGKYVLRLLGGDRTDRPPTGVDMDTLRRSGFVDG